MRYQSCKGLSVGRSECQLLPVDGVAMLFLALRARLRSNPDFPRAAQLGLRILDSVGHLDLPLLSQDYRNVAKVVGGLSVIGRYDQIESVTLGPLDAATA